MFGMESEQNNCMKTMQLDNANTKLGYNFKEGNRDENSLTQVNIPWLAWILDGACCKKMPLRTQATCQYSDVPSRPCSLTRVLVLCCMGSIDPISSSVKTLIRPHRSAGWSDSLLGVNVWRSIFLRSRPYDGLCILFFSILFAKSKLRQNHFFFLRGH